MSHCRVLEKQIQDNPESLEWNIRAIKSALKDKKITSKDAIVLTSMLKSKCGLSEVGPIISKLGLESYGHYSFLKKLLLKRDGYLRKLSVMGGVISRNMNHEVRQLIQMNSYLIQFLGKVDSAFFIKGVKQDSVIDILRRENMFLETYKGQNFDSKEFVKCEEEVIGLLLNLKPKLKVRKALALSFVLLAVSIFSPLVVNSSAYSAVEEEDPVVAYHLEKDRNAYGVFCDMNEKGYEKYLNTLKGYGVEFVNKLGEGGIRISIKDGYLHVRRHYTTSLKLSSLKGAKVRVAIENNRLVFFVNESVGFIAYYGSYEYLGGSQSKIDEKLIVSNNYFSMEDAFGNAKRIYFFKNKDLLMLATSSDYLKYFNPVFVDRGNYVSAVEIPLVTFEDDKSFVQYEKIRVELNSLSDLICGAESVRFRGYVALGNDRYRVRDGVIKGDKMEFESLDYSPQSLPDVVFKRAKVSVDMKTIALSFLPLKFEVNGFRFLGGMKGAKTSFSYSNGVFSIKGYYMILADGFYFTLDPQKEYKIKCAKGSIQIDNFKDEYFHIQRDFSFSGAQVKCHQYYDGKELKISNAIGFFVSNNISFTPYHIKIILNGKDVDLDAPIKAVISNPNQLLDSGLNFKRLQVSNLVPSGNELLLGFILKHTFTDIGEVAISIPRKTAQVVNLLEVDGFSLDVQLDLNLLAWSLSKSEVKKSRERAIRLLQKQGFSSSDIHLLEEVHSCLKRDSIVSFRFVDGVYRVFVDDREFVVSFETFNVVMEFVGGSFKIDSIMGLLVKNSDSVRENVS